MSFNLNFCGLGLKERVRFPLEGKSQKMWVQDQPISCLVLCFTGQYLLERGMLICVSSPPRFDRQPSTGRRRQSQGREENAPTERGRVFVNEDVQPDIMVNNIGVTTRSNRSELVVLYNQHVDSPYRSPYVVLLLSGEF